MHINTSKFTVCQHQSCSLRRPRYFTQNPVRQLQIVTFFAIKSKYVSQLHICVARCWLGAWWDTEAKKHFRYRYKIILIILLKHLWKCLLFQTQLDYMYFVLGFFDHFRCAAYIQMGCRQCYRQPPAAY